MNGTKVQLAGHLGSDGELRYTPGGQPVARLSVAVTERIQRGGQWADGATTWHTVLVWGQAAEHAVESLSKGDRVIVLGRLSCRAYETQEGEKRTVWEVTADEIGPSLANATAKPHRASVRREGAGE